MSIRVINKGGKVHPSVMLLGTGTLTLEHGAQIKHGCVIEMDNGKMTMGRGSVLGFLTVVQATGTITIGKDVLIGPQCTLLASYHVMSSNPEKQKMLVRSTLTFGNTIWVGAHCIINHGITLNNNCVVGANSFINADVEPNTVVGGSPAKFLKLKGQ